MFYQLISQTYKRERNNKILEKRKIWATSGDDLEIMVMVPKLPKRGFAHGNS